MTEMWLVSPKVEIGPEARRSASHAQDDIDNAVVVDSLEEALRDMSLVAGTTSILGRRTSNILRTAVTPEEFARRAALTSGRLALLFGRESSGLTNEELEECDIIVTIPASREYGVLNVSVAAAIVFYELFKVEMKSKRGYVEEADLESKERLLKSFEQLCAEVGLPDHRRRLAQRAFRNILARAFISKREATLLIGVFRRALKTKENSES